MRILIGIIVIVLSLLLVIYRERIFRFTGQIGWAETHFGPGGTFTLFLIIGFVGFFLGLMIATDTVNLLFGDFFTKIFGSVNS